MTEVVENVDIDLLSDSPTLVCKCHESGTCGKGSYITDFTYHRWKEDQQKNFHLKRLIWMYADHMMLF